MFFALTLFFGWRFYAWHVRKGPYKPPEPPDLKKLGEGMKAANEGLRRRR